MFKTETAQQKIIADICLAAIVNCPVIEIIHLSHYNWKASAKTYNGAVIQSNCKM